MDINLQFFELTEPLEPHPVKGMFYGGATGLFFFWLANPSNFGVPTGSVIAGYVLGGMTVGLITGGLLPAFRNRWLAGFIVGSAMALGGTVAWSLWDEMLPFEFIVFSGIAAAIFYAALLWDYNPNGAPENGGPQ